MPGNQDTAVGEETLALCIYEEACFKGRLLLPSFLPYFTYIFQPGGLPPPGREGQSSPFRTGSQMTLRFPSTRASAAQPSSHGEHTASSCQTHFHPVPSPNHSTWLSRFGSFFKTRDWNTSVRPRVCSWSSRLKEEDGCVSNGLWHICWDDRRQNWGGDVNHKEASDSRELALSSNGMSGGELPATAGILTGLDATGGESTLGMPRGLQGCIQCSEGPRMTLRHN